MPYPVTEKLRFMKLICASAALLISHSCYATLQERVVHDMERIISAPGAIEDPVETMSKLVDAQVQSLRASLESEERGRDLSELLQRKCTVDSLLMPLHFVRDAMHMQVAGDSGSDLLRCFRTEWQSQPPTAVWSHPDGEVRAQRAMASWLPTRTRGLHAAKLTMEVRVGSETWTLQDAPPVQQWTVDSEWVNDEPAVHARCWWGLPIAERQRVDFPLSVEGLDLWWEQSGASLKDDRGNSHHEAWTNDAIFNNPAELYAVFDSFRLSTAADFELAVHGHGPNANINNVSTGNDSQSLTMPRAFPGNADMQETVRIRTVRRADGSELRQEVWKWRGEQLESVTIDQGPVHLLHQSERGVELVSEIEGTETSRVPFRASSQVVQFPNGAQLVLAFRTPDSIRDLVPAGVLAVPDKWTLTVDGKLRAWADFQSVRLQADDATDPFVTARNERLQGESRLHSHLAREISDCFATQDSARGHVMTQQLRNRYQGLWTTPLHQSAELELLAFRCAKSEMDGLADTILMGPWMNLTNRSQAAAAIERWDKCAETGFATRIARLSGADRVQPEQTVATEEADRPSIGGSDGADPEVGMILSAQDRTRADIEVESLGSCDPSDLSAGSKRVYSAVRDAIDAIEDQKMIAQVMRVQLCRACHESDELLEAITEENARRIGDEARLALMNNFGRCCESGFIVKCAEKFAKTVIAAVQTPPRTEAVVQQGRKVWNACSTHAQSVLRELMTTKQSEQRWSAGSILHAGQFEHTLTAVQTELNARSALVGNRMIFAFDPVTALEIPDDQWTDDSLRAAIRFALVMRCDGLTSSARMPLALNSDKSQQKLLAESIAQVVLFRFVQWRQSQQLDGHAASAAENESDVRHP